MTPDQVTRAALLMKNIKEVDDFIARDFKGGIIQARGDGVKDPLDFLQVRVDGHEFRQHLGTLAIAWRLELEDMGVRKEST